MRLVLGVGNQILGDDAAGIYAAERLAQRIPKEKAEVRKFGGSATYLFDEILGYDEVIIIDTIAIKGYQEGDIVHWDPYNVKANVDSVNPHDYPFHIMLEIYKSSFPEQMPKKMRFFGIVTTPQLTFKQEISQKIKESADKVVNMILEYLEV